MWWFWKEPLHRVGLTDFKAPKICCGLITLKLRTPIFFFWLSCFFFCFFFTRFIGWNLVLHHHTSAKNVNNTRCIAAFKSFRKSRLYRGLLTQSIDFFCGNVRTVCLGVPSIVFKFKFSYCPCTFAGVNHTFVYMFC